MLAGLSICVTADATDVSWGGYTWDQDNAPNVGAEISSGVLGGATFNVTSNDVTSPLTNFPTGVAGGTFNDQVGVLSVLIGDQSNGVRAVNLPFGDNIGGATFRRGISVGWAPGTQNIGMPVLPNLAGTDFVMFESGDRDEPDGLMVRARDAVTQQYTAWHYYAPKSQTGPTVGTSTSPVLFAYEYDFSNMGLAAGAQVDQIQIANMVRSDRIASNAGVVGGKEVQTVATNPTFRPGMGQFGGAVEFNGAGDFATFQSPLFDVGASGTLNFWVKMDKLNDRNQFFEGPGDSGFEFQYRTNSGGQLYGRTTNNGDFVIRSGGDATTLGDNSWHNIQYTWDFTAGEMRIYLDGAESGYLSGLTPSDLTWDSITDTTLGVMNVGYDPGAGRYFDGLMDDVAWFDKVLTQTERDNIRAAGAAALLGDPSLIAFWDFDNAVGDTLAVDEVNNIEMRFFTSGLFDTYLAEGQVLPEIGGLFSPTNPGPNPGPLASFNIPFGNSTFDPDPFYIFATHNLQQLVVPEPSSAAVWGLVASAALTAVTRWRRRSREQL